MNLILAPDPILRTACAPFDFAGQKAAWLEREMIEVMIRERGIGLAAPQVGRLCRVLVMKPMGRAPIGLFNPEIVTLGGGYATGKEGCLSFPGQTRLVRRAQQAAVRFWTAAGLERTEVFVGLDARCVQHELDHLDGVTFDAKASPQSAMAMKALAAKRGRR